MQIYLSTQADTDNCTCWHHLHRSHHSCTCVQGSHPRSPRSCVPWSLGGEIKLYDTGNREVTVVVIISVLFLTFPTHLITSTQSCYTTIDKLMYTVKWAVKRFSGCWVFTYSHGGSHSGKARTWQSSVPEGHTPCHVCLFYNLSWFQWLPLWRETFPACSPEGSRKAIK